MNEVFGAALVCVACYCMGGAHAIWLIRTEVRRWRRWAERMHAAGRLDVVDAPLPVEASLFVLPTATLAAALGIDEVAA